MICLKVSNLDILEHWSQEFEIRSFSILNKFNYGTLNPPQKNEKKNYQIGNAAFKICKLSWLGGIPFKLNFIIRPIEFAIKSGSLNY